MITFYVSGHGYGHATRAAAVVRAIHSRRPRLRIAVRTAAPAMLFGVGVDYANVAMEGTISETADALSVDMCASADNLRQFLSKSSEVLDKESEFLLNSGTRLIAGDVPFICGDLSRRTGIPAIAMGNFLWHWALADTADQALLDRIRHGYAGYNLALRMPLSHPDDWDVFPNVMDVPLVTPRSERPRDEIRRELGLDRTTVLLGGRGRLTGDAFDRVRRDCPDLQFLVPDDAPVYSDLVRAADVMASKIGYSVAAECIAEGKRLLYPPRHGFREEAILRSAVPRHIPAISIPVADWLSGNWRPWLLQLLELPQPQSALRTDGAAVCAEIILTRADYGES